MQPDCLHNSRILIPGMGMPLRKQLMLLGAALLILLAGLPVAYQVWPARDAGPDSLSSEAVAALAALQAHSGAAELQDWRGQRWALVFFGFTHCADTCPATLSRISRLLEQQDGHADQLQPIFITLDPERDTPEHLAEYLGFFDPRILGLTGSSQQIQQLAAEWGVYWRRVPVNGGYLLDHATSLFLLNPQGELVQRFSGQLEEDDLAAQISRLLVARASSPGPW